MMMESAAMVVRRAPPSFFSLLAVLLLAASCTAQDGGPRFQCSSTTTSCQALVGYVTDNETTYDAIKSLFQVKSLRSLYGFNNVEASTPASAKVPANTTVRVPFPCTCANGTGISNKRPTYTVKKGDSLYNISTITFKGFVTFLQIAAVSGVKDPALINVGQKLWIPLPCSCDPVDGLEAVHLAHIVAKGSSLEEIAAMAGTTEETLARVNNISDPKSLLAGQILDVPLRACNSSIQADADDHLLRVPKNSYALTADNCVNCSCSSSSWQLQCEMTQDKRLANSSTMCPAPPPCPANSTGGPAIQFGGEAPSGCGTIRCEYAGHKGSNILTTPVTNTSACGTPPSGAHALRPLLLGPSRWTTPLLLLVAPINTALLLLAFL